ncbi:sugar phosphate isomerase/epimerase [Aminobacter sp. SR38]|jgi:sugar phosphate isomerase/epimerase|uniref:sugar phosphate isomerase/epimerase family protein n=1 Tax=Aminobacter sp. SR38 TaxID=2774562 RepID=UPI00177C5250|nr:sugar phosphate isomerase/epimerase [Aminobacter sp. SR38]QOF73800.1 sugar phosphate isomerase/epimerase [Aminobacter sp. SR38]
MDWSFQLYSARNFQPWQNVLKTLGALGYAQVEGFGAVYEEPEAFRAELDKNGLAMPSGHFGIDLLEQEFATAAGIARTLGMKLIACPWLEPADRPTDADGWRAFGRRLAAIGAKANDAGFDFAWHNHDFEFAPVGGVVPQRLILEAAPEVGWEMDVAWVIRGGSDPLHWIEECGPRILAVHVKDIAPQGLATDEDGWSDVGHGTVDWAGLVTALRKNTPAKYFVMEHDNPADFERFASRSIAAAKTF